MCLNACVPVYLLSLSLYHSPPLPTSTSLVTYFHSSVPLKNTNNLSNIPAYSVANSNHIT